MDRPIRLLFVIAIVAVLGSAGLAKGAHGEFVQAADTGRGSAPAPTPAPPKHDLLTAEDLSRYTGTVNFALTQVEKTIAEVRKGDAVLFEQNLPVLLNEEKRLRKERERLLAIKDPTTVKVAQEDFNVALAEGVEALATFLSVLGKRLKGIDIPASSWITRDNVRLVDPRKIPADVWPRLDPVFSDAMKATMALYQDGKRVPPSGRVFAGGQNALTGKSYVPPKGRLESDTFDFINLRNGMAGKPNDSNAEDLLFSSQKLVNKLIAYHGKPEAERPASFSLSQP